MDEMKKNFEFWEKTIGLNTYITIFEIPGKGEIKGFKVSIKDNISTAGIRTTCASKMLENYIPPFDAKVIELLKRHGVTLFGKTNMDEFAMGNSTETSYFGPTLNPWSLDRVPGGSSGGSAVSVATGQVNASLGSDTGGSIRNPAAYNYVLGLKPTYGAVSRFGLIAYAESLEQIGPLAKNVDNLAKLLYMITEYDDRDGTMFTGESRRKYRKSIKDFLEGNCQTIKKKRIFVPLDLVDLASQQVKSSFWKAINYLQSIGYDVIEGKSELLHLSLPAYYIIAMVEASSNLARYDGVKFGYRAEAGNYTLMIMKTRAEGFGFEVKARILAGAFASSVGYKDRFYLRALKVRRQIKEYFLSILKENDFIAIPTAPDVPPKFGESLGPKGYVNDIYTVPANLTGVPAISIPAGLINGFLPVGIQFMTSWYDEWKILHVAREMESSVYDPEIRPKGKNAGMKNLENKSEQTSIEDVEKELKDEIKRIAWLARIWVEGEEEKYAKHFMMVMDLFEKLGKLETAHENIQPLYHPLELRLKPRKDVINEKQNVSEKLKQFAPKIDEDNYIKIPRLY